MTPRFPRSVCHGLAALLGAALLLAAQPARAQDSPCFGIAAEDAALAAATVAAGSTRLYFQAAPVPKAAPGRAFLVAGDVVVISRRQGDFACASYLNGQGQATAGWLPMQALQPISAPPVPAMQAWAGRWQGSRSLGQRIDIVAGKAALRVEGSATWGSDDPERVRRGGINTGSLQAETVPQGGALAFATDKSDRTVPYDQGDPLECRARMMLLGPYLVVQDNLRCGGMNVSFSGLYRRTGGG